MHNWRAVRAQVRCYPCAYAERNARRDARDGEKMPISVLLADDKEFVRSSIRRLLDAQRDIEIVGEAAIGCFCLIR